MHSIDLEKELEEISVLLESELKNSPTIKPNMNGKASWRTICSVLREIYHNTEDEKVKTLCIEATIQAKKMSRKLLEYRNERKIKDKQE